MRHANRPRGREVGTCRSASSATRQAAAAPRSPVRNPAATRAREPPHVDPGETIEASERVIVSPAAGIYEPALGSPDVSTGDVIGHVAIAGQDAVPVRSPFTGRLVEVVAWRGERVLHRQRIAWLRLAA